MKLVMSTNSRRRLATAIVAAAAIAVVPACGGNDSANESQSVEEVEESNQEAQELQEDFDEQQLDLGEKGDGSAPALPGDPEAVEKNLEQQHQLLERLSEGSSP